MKILVLGNSNSVSPMGYIGGLAVQFPGARLQNRSVGHSPGTQFAYYGAMDYSAFDLVIFDSVANDELFAEEVGGWEFMRDLYYELFSTIASQTRLLVVGFSGARSTHLSRMCTTCTLTWRHCLAYPSSTCASSYSSMAPQSYPKACR